MNDRRILLLLLALASAACAALPESELASSREERIYRTGSNIPVHDRTSSGQVLTLDRDAFEDYLTRNKQMPPRGRSN